MEQLSELVANHSRTYLADGAPVDIGDLLRALPLKDDIRSMLANLEDIHRRETKELRGKLLSVTARVEMASASAKAKLSRDSSLNRGLTYLPCSCMWMTLKNKGGATTSVYGGSPNQRVQRIWKVL